MASELPNTIVKARSIEDALFKLSDENLMGEFDDIFKLMPVTDDTSCGVGRFFRGPTLQKYLIFLENLFTLLHLFICS